MTDEKLMLNLMEAGETYLRQVIRYVTSEIPDDNRLSRENFLDAILAIVQRAKRP